MELIQAEPASEYRVMSVLKVGGRSMLLRAARLEDQSPVLRREEFDLAVAISDEIERLEPLLTQLKCPLTVDVSPGMVGSWDRFRVEQIVRNIIVNAAKYGGGKTVELTARLEAGGASFLVRDHGGGIAKKDQERIFERFERAISSNEVSGMGLGLFIARRITELHGGRIEVESELGQGAVFRVWLPMQFGSSPRSTALVSSI